ncbi:hypothetical protein GBF38_006695 [Nibea albiflora]|uniref:Uncharacterized protein n=1 Tax=Nibea albiflora TaxID=240163 RepID=A0ACB7EGD1_NIBAL|nr:hypothetical protein GBF38_006695 [Nibea albiflora]
MCCAFLCRLLVLCLWLLHVDVNCDHTQKGDVLRAREGQVPTGVRIDDGNYERWREPRIFRVRTAGYKKSNVNREDHTAGSESSHIQIPSPVIPETPNLPKGQVNRLKSGFNSASLAQGRSTVVNNREIHQANSDSARVLQVPIYRSRISEESASPMQAEGRDAELVLQASNQEGQSERSAEVGASLEQNKTVTVAPPKRRLAENVGRGDEVVTSPLGTDQSEV